MSRPSEPEEMVSTSIALSVLPSRMIEPLPKLRSIWESAASRAFDLSMDDPSTRRSAAWLAPLMGIVLLMTGFPGAGKRVPGRAAPRLRPANLQKRHCTRFVLVRNMFFWGRRVLSYFRGQCPNFRGQCPNLQNAGNELANRKAYYRFDVLDYDIFGLVHAGVASIPPHTYVMEVNTKPLLSI